MTAEVVKPTAMAHRPPALPFEPENLEQMERLAVQLAKSSLLPPALRGKPSDVFLTLMIGKELGLSATTAIRAVHVIDGKPTMSADLIVGLVKRHPECVSFRLVKSSDEVATYETERAREGKTELSFTIQQAKTANLLGKLNWKSYPAAMLRARASAALARAVYPDVALGLYDPDELETKDVQGERVFANEPEPEPTPDPDAAKNASAKLVERIGKVQSLEELGKVEAWALSEERPTKLYGVQWEQVIVPAMAAQRAKLLPSSDAAKPEAAAEPQTVYEPGATEPEKSVFESLMAALASAEEGRDREVLRAVSRELAKAEKEGRLTADEGKTLHELGAAVKAKLEAKS